jgi:8-oxo-dGTP pyrophosphatase MutT (NUDIX family)
VPDLDLRLAAVAARLAPLLDRPHVPAPTGAHAAVAAVLRERAGHDGREGTEVLLIRRAEHERDPWSGHMAFPGGRRDPGDVDLFATAVREAREEVGLDLGAQGTLLGRLEDLQAISRSRPTGMTITPFVFSLAGEAVLRFDPEEVAEALWVPLAPLARGEGGGTVVYEREAGSIELPCWRIEGRVVWGLTYRMIQSLFEVLAA